MTCASQSEYQILTTTFLLDAFLLPLVCIKYFSLSFCMTISSFVVWIHNTQWQNTVININIHIHTPMTRVFTPFLEINHQLIFISFTPQNF